MKLDYSVIILYLIILIWTFYVNANKDYKKENFSNIKSENIMGEWYIADYSNANLGNYSTMLKCHITYGEPAGSYWLILELNNSKMSVNLHYDINKDRYVGIIADKPLIITYKDETLNLVLNNLNKMIFTRTLRSYGINNIQIDPTKIDSRVWTTMDTQDSNRKNNKYTFYRASDQLMALYVNGTIDRNTFIIQIDDQYAELDHMGKIMNYISFNNDYTELKMKYFDSIDVLI